MTMSCNRCRVTIVVNTPGMARTVPEWTFPNNRQWNVIDLTSHYGCVGEPAETNFPLKYMATFITFDRLLLPHVAEFSNHLHTDVRFQNSPTHWWLLKPHGINCVRAVR